MYDKKIPTDLRRFYRWLQKMQQGGENTYLFSVFLQSAIYSRLSHDVLRRFFLSSWPIFCRAERVVLMKRRFLFAGVGTLVSCVGLIVLSGLPASAACLENGAGRTLYILMQSENGDIERNLPVGDVMCLNVEEQTKVDANILPYGGARFGCRFKLKGKEQFVITEFHTMNKCKFLELGR
nr:hypothetical protein [uncultured Cohaesibacter sp.]